MKLVKEMWMEVCGIFDVNVYCVMVSDDVEVCVVDYEK